VLGSGRADADDGWGVGEHHAVTIERFWHVKDRQGQIMALAFRAKSLHPSKPFTLRLQADYSIKCFEPAGLTVTTAGLLASFTLSSEYGTYMTVKARLWPCISG